MSHWLYEYYNDLAVRAFPNLMTANELRERLLSQQGALPVAYINNGSKLYTVMSKNIGGGYTPLGTGLKETRLEASQDMRAAGGGRKGKVRNLVVYSFTFGQAAEQVFDVVVKVKAKSKADAQAKANAVRF